MMFRRRRAEAELARYERNALRDLLARLGATDEIFQGVAALLDADGEAARLAVLQRYPDLRSDRGSGALSVVVNYAVMTGLVETLPRVQSLQDWLRDTARPNPEPNRETARERLSLEGGVYALLNEFGAASANADQQFLRTHDLTEIRAGIELWETLVTGELFDDIPPEALVDSQLMAAMLYARRYEVESADADLDHAFALLRQARQHTVPGSESDILMRLSSATWLMLRFGRHNDRTDLDQAITSYTELVDMSPAGGRNAGVASANLGRALLVRQQLTGSHDDRRRAIQALRNAMLWLPQGDAALTWVQQALARLSWTNS
jgi:hypothetical protein